MPPRDGDLRAQLQRLAADSDPVAFLGAVMLALVAAIGRVLPAAPPLARVP